MKNKSFLYSLLAVLMCMCTAKSFAHDIEVKNADGVTIYYSWRNDGTELAVSYYGADLLESMNYYSGEVIIPESVEYGGRAYKVTAIYGYAFADCSVTSVTIPNSVTSIEDYAFSGCSSLTTIVSEIEKPFKIYKYVFFGISSDAQLVVPKGTKAAYQATDGWYYVSTIVEAGEAETDQPVQININDINYKVTGSGEAEVVSVDNGVTSITIPSIISHNNKSYKVTAIANNAFYKCMSLISITIPNSVTFIGVNAFCQCTSLTSIIIPNSVITIASSAFIGCSALTSVNIPKSVTTIGESAFALCENLTSVSIENGVMSIGEEAFYSCSNLSSVIIPNSVTSIGSRVFDRCSRLSNVISEIETPFEISTKVFSGISSEAILTVPKGTKAAYQATVGWNQFTNIVEAGDVEPDQPGQIHINDIFYKLTGSGEAEVVSVEEGETSVTIPSTISYNNNTYKVTSIAKEVFENREHLAAVIWEPEAQFNAKVNNPNFLLYVSDEKYASHTVKNVVVNSVAENIELTDAANGNDFYCPKAFKAKSIIYSHNYQMETGLGDSRGWETIVLPFDVQKYTHATKGELESFTTWSKGSSKKPFWLFELTTSGYKDVAGIKANIPYIISLPNNQQYEQQYQIPGIVTFSASDVEVQKSDNLKPVSYQGRTFVPNYTNQNNADFLALNVSNNYVTNPGRDISGSKFVRGLRAVHPFEAYMTTTDNTRSIDVMDGMPTSIKGVRMDSDEKSSMKVYDIRGRQMSVSAESLKPGIYIVNGKKMIIK